MMSFEEFNCRPLMTMGLLAGWLTVVVTRPRASNSVARAR
jgi:hypothetical protein